MKNTKNQPKEVSKMTNVDMNVNVNVNVNKNTVICVAILSSLALGVYLTSEFGFSKESGLRIISNPELFAKSA